MNDLEEWLQSMDLGQYTDVFNENDIDREILGELGETDLEKLGIASLEYRKKLLKAIARLRADDISSSSTLSVSHSTSVASSAADQHQVSMRFSAIVLGASELLEQKQRISYRALKREFELDDGYPQAHEHDAERALRAALGIVEAMSDLNADHSLIQGRS